MSYTKQTWATGDTITAEKLNHMEGGIAGAGGVLVVGLQEDGQTLNKTWQEIFDAMSAGSIAVVKTIEDENSITYYQVNTAFLEQGQYTILAGANSEYVASSADGYPKVSFG